MTKQIFKQSVGIDMSKDTFCACFCQRQSDKSFVAVSNRSFDKTSKGFSAFSKWLERYHQKGVILHTLMEATGVYYEDLAYYLNESGYRVSVLLPSKTAAFAKSLAVKSKTDKLDAQNLAQMSLERDLPVWTPPSPKMLTIKRLCRERAELLAQKNATGNRLHAKQHAHESEKPSLKRNQQLINFLDKQITEVEKAIKQTIDEDADIKKGIEKVCSIKGVAWLTAAVIISETNGFTLFKNKAQLVSYAGYDVVLNESGTSVRGQAKISKKGNARIRKALYFPALCAIKYDPNLKALYDRVFDNTKIKMKAYVAVQRKILVLIYTLFKNKSLYDPKFNKKQEVYTKEAETLSLPL